MCERFCRLAKNHGNSAVLEKLRGSLPRNSAQLKRLPVGRSGRTQAQRIQRW
jgi:hypothetical protein